MKTRKMLMAAAAAATLPVVAAINVVPMPNKVVERDGVCDVANAAKSYEKDDSIAAEGYRLVVAKDGVKIASSDEAGRFYALQTLAQLTTDGKAPCVEIEDAPRFKWRGVLWDDCRHFFGKEALMKNLRAMAYHKLNVLHWVLTQDQGWRIEIKKYPELTVKGSVRPGSPKPTILKEPGKGGWQNNNIPYGPYYYSQDDIREIVAYAEKLHIKIIPEIEIPGHSVAALSAYPELGCTGEQFEPWWRWGVNEHIYCGGNPKVIEFLEDVLDEVCELFPVDTIHIGGDEAPKSRWKKCPKCAAKMKQLGLSDYEDLQGYFTSRINDILKKHGKTAICTCQISKFCEKYAIVIKKSICIRIIKLISYI